MKAVAKYCVVLLVLVTFLGSCGLNENVTNGFEENQPTQLSLDFIDQSELDSLNEKLDRDYESFDQALNGQVEIYEADKNNENLFRVCLVLMEVNPRCDYYEPINKYFGNLFDTMEKDMSFYKYINNEITYMSLFVVEYLYSLYETDMKERFAYVVNNLELYVEDSTEIITTAASCVQEIDKEKGALDDYIVIRDALMKYEKKYSGNLELMPQILIAKSLATCAEKLGDAELAEEYRKKGDNLLEEANELVN